MTETARSSRAFASADNRPRVHIWPAGEMDYQISFGPTATRSQQRFPSLGDAVEGARMHAGGFRAGAVIIIEGPAHG